MPFEENVYDAILREKNYEENICGLKNNLGTNIGKLVEKMIKIENKKQCLRKITLFLLFNWFIKILWGLIT